MSADRVRWFHGGQFGIVPAACVRAIVAAAPDATHVAGTTAVALFTALACSADGEGDAGTVAAAARMLDIDPGAARRAVATVLEPAGVATRTPTGVVLHHPSDQPAPRPPARKPQPEARQPARSGRAAQRGEARQPARAPLSTERTENPQTPPSPPSAQLELVHPAPPAVRKPPPAAFDRFWQVFPRRTGKGAARKAFERAVAKVGVDAVMAGAQRLADDPNLPEAQYVPHPATWLNQERWDDDPLPARAGAAPSSAMGRTMSALGRLASGELSLPGAGPGRVIDVGEAPLGALGAQQ